VRGGIQKEAREVRGMIVQTVENPVPGVMIVVIVQKTVKKQKKKAFEHPTCWQPF
jgi:hypothetical protein